MSDEERIKIQLNDRQAQEMDYLLARLSRLVGGTISEVEVQADTDFAETGEFWPVFTVEFSDGREPLEITVCRDPEGNGPGWLDGLPDD